jgi:hypothetical protein
VGTKLVVDFLGPFVSWGLVTSVALAVRFPIMPKFEFYWGSCLNIPREILKVRTVGFSSQPKSKIEVEDFNVPSWDVLENFLISFATANNRSSLVLFAPNVQHVIQIWLSLTQKAFRYFWGSCGSSSRSGITVKDSTVSCEKWLSVCVIYTGKKWGLVMSTVYYEPVHLKWGFQFVLQIRISDFLLFDSII